MLGDYFSIHYPSKTSDGPAFVPALTPVSPVREWTEATLAECCPRCLRDGWIERESECKKHGNAGAKESQ